MSAPDRIWLTIDRRGKVEGDPDAHVKPCADVADAYVEYVRAAEADALRAEVERLRDARDELAACLTEAIDMLDECAICNTGENFNSPRFNAALEETNP